MWVHQFVQPASPPRDMAWLDRSVIGLRRPVGVGGFATTHPQPPTTRRPVRRSDQEMVQPRLDRFGPHLMGSESQSAVIGPGTIWLRPNRVAEKEPSQEGR